MDFEPLGGSVVAVGLFVGFSSFRKLLFGHPGESASLMAISWCTYFDRGLLCQDIAVIPTSASVIMQILLLPAHIQRILQMPNRYFQRLFYKRCVVFH